MRLKKIVCYLLAICILGQVQVLSVFAVTSDPSLFAEISVQENDSLTSSSGTMTAWTNAARETIEGKRVVSLNNTQLYLYCGVSDTVAYNLDDYSPLKITVTYFDRGTGFFELAYKGYRSNHLVNSEAWNSAEVVHLNNTGQWKSHTFYLNNIPLDNNTTGWDFRIGTYSLRKNATTVDSVPIQSICVEESDLIFAEISVQEDDRITSTSGTMTAWTDAPRETVDEKRVVSLSNTKNYLYCGVVDTVAYNLDDYSPLKISITYFDRGAGFFELAYKGYRSEHLIDSSVWNSAEVVHLNNTGQWKTHTFYLNNIPLDNNTTGWDFRIGTYSISENAISAEPVSIYSICVEEVVEPEIPFELLNLASNQTGNIFDKKSGTRFEADFLNASKRNLNTFVKATVTDENDTVVWEKNWSNNLLAKEKKQIILSPEINRYGIYKLKIETNAFYDYHQEDTHKQTFEQEFSIVYKVGANDKNNSFGSATLINIGWAERGVTEQVVLDAGCGWIKEEIQWRLVETEKGVYEIPEKYWETLKNAKKKGLKVILSLVYANPIYSDTPNEVTEANVKDLPSTTEQINAFAAWAEWMAKETKGYVDAFSVWNEYNLKNFNYNEEGSQVYVNLMKATYPAVKRGNENAIVVAGETAGFSKKHLREVLLYGGKDYMDAWGVHDYDWTPPFSPQTLIDSYNDLKSTMSLYGDVPIWITEYGFGTYAQKSEGVRGYTLKEQANSIVLHYALVKGYDIADVTIQFRVCDELNNPTESERAFGLTRDYRDPERPHAAKPSYLAVSAMNNFIGNSAKLMGKWKIDDKNAYAVWFYNFKLKKDIILLGAEAEHEGDLPITLDTPSVELYDLYGNKKDILMGNNGEYVFAIGEDITYVIGEWTKPNKMINEILLGETSVSDFAELKVNDKLRANLKISEVWSDKTMSCYFAFYNEDGILISVDIEEIPSNEQDWLGSEVIVPQGAAELKVFVWDNESCIPLAEVFRL